MQNQELSWRLFVVQSLFLFVLLLPLAKNFYAVIGSWGMAIWLLTLVLLALLLWRFDRRPSRRRTKRFSRGHPWRL